MRLISCLFLGKGIVNLNKFTQAPLHIALGRVYSLYIEKLKLVVWSCHTIDLYCCSRY